MSIIERRGHIADEHQHAIREAPQLTERLPAYYEDFLGFELRELKGQAVLNIGCGKTGKFEKAAAAAGADLHALSPYFASEQGEAEAERNFGENVIARWIRTYIKRGKWPKIVAAIAEDLPYENSSFDRILALYSVPLYSYSEHYPTLFNEIVRTLKNNGKASLYPVSETDLPNILTILEKFPVQVDTREVSERSDNVYAGQKAYRLVITKHQKTK